VHESSAELSQCVLNRIGVMRDRCQQVLALSRLAACDLVPSSTASPDGNQTSRRIVTGFSRSFLAGGKQEDFHLFFAGQ